MFHVEKAGVDRRDDLLCSRRIPVKEGLGLHRVGREENRHQAVGERAVEDVGVEVEGAQQDGHQVVAAEKFLLDVAGSCRQALHLEPGQLVLRHAHRPAQAGPSGRLGVGSGSGRQVEIVEEKLRRDQLTFAVGDRDCSLPIVDV